MLDRALAKMFASFSTIFLVACLLAVPVHAVHAFVFKDALAIRELGSEVASLPEGRQVRGVDKNDIAAERMWLLIVMVAELALVPLVYRAAGQVLAVADEGGVPEVMDAYRHLGSTTGGVPPAGPVTLGVVFACGCALLVWWIGDALTDVASADGTWAAVGIARGVAAATFMAIAAGTAAALSTAPRAAPTPPANLDLY